MASTTNTPPSTDFSDPVVFAYWAELAQKDPARFERERRAVVDGFINESPKRHQALGRQIQSRVDAARVSDPVESFARLRSMMLTSLASLGENMLSLHESIEEGEVRRRCIAVALEQGANAPLSGEEKIAQIFKTS